MSRLLKKFHWPTLSFRGRLFIVIISLLMLLQVVTLVFVYQASRDNVEQSARQRLLLGQRFFESVFDSRSRYLNDTVSTIAKDWGFRDAAGRRDRNTIISVLSNHGRRIDADMGLFLGQGETGLASTLPLNSLQQQQLRQQLVDGNRVTNEYFVTINNRLYQFVVRPVKAPLIIGNVAMGFLVDDPLAVEFKQLTELEISFVLARNNQHQLIASTLEGEGRSAMDLEAIAWDNPVPFYTGAVRQTLVQHFPLRTISEGGLYVLAQQSLSDLLASFDRWWINLLLVFAIVLTAAVVIAALVSRSVTEPMLHLLHAVKRMTAGEYDQEIDVAREDEIGELAKNFTVMQRTVFERETEIRYHAEHDGLTDLLNRRRFLEELAGTINANPHVNLVLVMFKLDRFKDVNDTLGHHIGDQLLVHVAQRLRYRFTDICIAHNGAGQFILYQSLDGFDQVQELQQRIEAVFDRPFTESGINMVLQAHQGLALYPDHTGEAKNLLRLAEVAMYSAKDRHLPAAIYDHEQDPHSIMRLTLMSDLPKAITDNELCLYYQPTLALDSEGNIRVAKVESLARWIHPMHGFVMPDDFISLAEQSGAITDLTAWAIDTALQQCQRWRHARMEIGVAVNISAVDLFRGKLDQLVPELLKRYQLPAQVLTLEVTESEIMEDPGQACRILAELRGLGVRLSVDDYGTGYSSLAQLKQLPVDELKIDKSFVMELLNNQDDQVIVRSTIELGHTMGLQVVAEGVESEGALKYLRKLGCDYFQGFYISKPMPVKETDQWLTETHYSIVKPRLQQVQ